MNVSLYEQDRLAGWSTDRSGHNTHCFEVYYTLSYSTVQLKRLLVSAGNNYCAATIVATAAAEAECDMRFMSPQLR